MRTLPTAGTVLAAALLLAACSTSVPGAVSAAGAPTPPAATPPAPAPPPAPLGAADLTAAVPPGARPVAVVGDGGTGAWVVAQDGAATVAVPVPLPAGGSGAGAPVPLPHVADLVDVHADGAGGLVLVGTVADALSLVRVAAAGSVATVPLDVAPDTRYGERYRLHRSALSPDGGTLYLAGTLTAAAPELLALSATDGSVRGRGTVDLPAHSAPRDLTAAPDGTLLATFDTGLGTGQVQRGVLLRFPADLTGRPEAVDLAPDAELAGAGEVLPGAGGAAVAVVATGTPDSRERDVRLVVVADGEPRAVDLADAEWFLAGGVTVGGDGRTAHVLATDRADVTTSVLLAVDLVSGDAAPVELCPDGDLRDAASAADGTTLWVAGTCRTPEGVEQPVAWALG
ncbi:hypothetical protein ACI8AC_24345 [Geodermatophilus sp. SYSU D00758]